jgi:PAS domain S-box-containing protein
MADLVVDGDLEMIPQWYHGNYSKSELVEGAYQVTDFFPKLGDEGKWLYSTTAKIKDSKGNTIGSMTILEDITQRKLTEEALKKSEARYRTIFENTGAATMIIEEDTSVSLVNTEFEKLTGYLQRDVEGKSWIELVSKDDVGRMMEYHNLRSIYPDLPPKNYEFRFLRRNGEVGDAYITIANIPGTSQRIASIVDMTSRKEAEKELYKVNEELKRSNEELKQFAYVASHDLQEPLRMIASFLNLLKKRHPGELDSESHEFIDFAVDGAKRMQEMINDLLIYSRLTTNDKKFEDVNCENILDQVLLNLKVSIEENGAVITHDPLPIVAGDYSQFIQLFQNLVSNAIKYRSQQTPRIHISAEKKEKEWLFLVQDNGIGIDSKFSDRIFMIFQRLHSREVCPGTGIGLSICRKIVERHGGRIWIDSELVKGSKFYFTVPIGVNY